MIRVIYCSVLLSIVFSIATYAQKSYDWKQGASGGYNYKYVTNDPTGTRFYTLKNGLTVIKPCNLLALQGPFLFEVFLNLEYVWPVN